MTTVRPPPASAFCSATVSSVLPSPTAPYFFTFTFSAAACCGSAIVGRAKPLQESFPAVLKISQLYPPAVMHKHQLPGPVGRDQNHGPPLPQRSWNSREN